MNSRHIFIALSQFCQDSEAPRQMLRREGFSFDENRSGRRLRAEELISAAQSASAIVAGLEPYDGATLRALPALKCISRCGVGVDSIDRDEARRLGIAVCTTPDVVAEPVAQLTVAMILSLARRLPEASAAMRAGHWLRNAGFLLSEWTVGIVGFGRIGQAVERCLRPFGPKICVADPGFRDGVGGPEGSKEAADRRCTEAIPRVGPTLRDGVHAGVALVDMNSLLAQADVVSIHAARPPAEGPLIGTAELQRMKRGARLVNTSRGYLVDEVALGEALKSGHLSGAALDVFETEPYNGPLVSFPQVLCTPHIGTLTRASRNAMELKAVENVISFLRGK